MTQPNLDTEEIEKFSRLAHRWWDPDGDFKPLHAINPARLAFIEKHCAVQGRQVLDVGCGGGLLSEALALKGGIVSGIDASAEALSTARLHALDAGFDIDYQQTTAEAYAETHAERFDVVTCMELLEHVPDPVGVIQACALLAKPGGKLFFSTINRNARAFALGILAAEYLLRLLPAGTHQYDRLIKPSELARTARHCGLELIGLNGIHYNPFTAKANLVPDTRVNYVTAFEKPAP